MFRSKLGLEIFQQKYQLGNNETWPERVHAVVEDVCAYHLSAETKAQLEGHMVAQRFLPGGRYLYYGGRQAKFWNNCYLLRGEEDTREEWGNVFKRSSSCLMTGGGIGVDYSVFRPEGAPLNRTGGLASGPVPMMRAVNEIGRQVMQGGSRRSAIYASLNWQHADARAFLKVKDWDNTPLIRKYTVGDAKRMDINFEAPLEFTNGSLNYDDHFLAWVSRGETPELYLDHIKMALRTGELGFSFNFGPQSNETLRNACTEVTSEDDSDVCNLASINMANVDSIEEFREIVHLTTKFLICGSMRSTLPYDKVYDVRERNRRLGLGLMGIHEWLLKRGHRYEVVPELRAWLEVYRAQSRSTADSFSDERSVSRPVACRAIAPTGTIGILAGTVPGIEPLFAAAYKRRFLKGKTWHYVMHLDSTAKMLVDEFGLDPDRLETSLSLAADPERRLSFQADIQEYVDQAISSTINLPAWGTELNNEDTAPEFARLIAKYAPRLRGLTVYPDGSRGGQPLTSIPYAEALASKGEVKEEANDVCALTGGGSCGV